MTDENDNVPIEDDTDNTGDIVEDAVENYDYDEDQIYGVYANKQRKAVQVTFQSLQERDSFWSEYIYRCKD